MVYVELCMPQWEGFICITVSKTSQCDIEFFEVLGIIFVDWLIYCLKSLDSEWINGHQTLFHCWADHALVIREESEKERLNFCLVICGLVLSKTVDVTFPPPFKLKNPFCLADLIWFLCSVKSLYFFKLVLTVLEGECV